MIMQGKKQETQMDASQPAYDQQAAAAGGETDYSVEWGAYYAAQAAASGQGGCC